MLNTGVSNFALNMLAENVYAATLRSTIPMNIYVFKFIEEGT
jgi:hypothetical protein